MQTPQSEDKRFNINYMANFVQFFLEHPVQFTMYLCRPSLRCTKKIIYYNLMKILYTSLGAYRLLLYSSFPVCFMTHKVTVYGIFLCGHTLKIYSQGLSQNC